MQCGEVRFKNISQLTFSGEYAEAYFSLDGDTNLFICDWSEI